MDSPVIDRNALRWPRRLAVALCVATFPLIWIGGMVTTYKAGMAVPDWPTTYGYNLFLYPWQTWLYGPFDILIEHGHRLLGALVGLLVLALAITITRKSQLASLRVPGYLAVIFVCTQGLLGGMRVRFDDRVLAMVHGCFGLFTFAYLSGLVVATSPDWWERTAVSGAGAEPALRFRRQAWQLVGWVYLQVVLGSLLRHVPLQTSPFSFQLYVIFHLAMVVWLVWRTWSLWFEATRPGATTLAVVWRCRLLLGLVACQIGLGVATWVMRYGWPAALTNWDFAAGYTITANSWWQAAVTTAHVATGGVILATAACVAVHASRPLRPAVAVASSGFLWMEYAR